MRRKPYFIISLLLCSALLIFTFNLSADKKDEKTQDEIKEKRSTIKKPYLKKYQKIEVPIDLFRLNRDLLIPGGRNSLFQFYVRDLKLRVRVKPNAFRHTTLRMPKMPKLGKRWGRVLMQGLGHFIYATSSYWVRQDVMKEDWEYRLTWADQKKRFLFLDGPRFDSNTFQFNWTHSMAGAMYYNYARVNNLNIFESMLFTVGASTFWENMCLLIWCDVIRQAMQVNTIFSQRLAVI